MKSTALFLIGLVLIQIYIFNENDRNNKGLSRPGLSYREVHYNPPKKVDLSSMNIKYNSSKAPAKKDFKSLDPASESKFTFLIFWGTWCPNCQTEIKEVYNLFKKQTKADVTLIAINLDSAKDQLKVKTYWDKINIPIQNIFLSDYKIDSSRQSKDELLAQFDLTVLPTYALVESSDKLLYKIDGRVDWKNINLNKILNKINKENQ
jgi:thiol-disulfide isomerase/thioredoxin